MKKYLLRTLVALLTFGVGLGAVIIWMFSERIDINEERKFENVETANEKSKELLFKTNRKKTGKIEIHFNGFRKTEYGTIAEIEIVNDSPKTIYFWSVSKDSINTHLQFNGIKSKPIAVCGNVSMNLKDFSLNSGEVLKATMPPNRMEEFVPLKKQNLFRVGYYLRKDGEKDSEVFWSEELQLPKWVQKELKEY